MKLSLKLPEYIFLAVFVVSFLAQIFIWQYKYIVDVGMWADQSMYFAQDDNSQFNSLGGYGHPGGPIILGTVFLSEVFGLPYYPDSISCTMAILNATIIATIAVLCFLMSRSLWWVAVSGLLSINSLYFHSTPPSGLASLLAVCLCLVTLYIYKKEKQNFNQETLLLWAIVAGMFVATRADIGGFLVVLFGFLLSTRLYIRQLIFVALSTILFFILFDPYMWTMPIMHLKDLIFKGSYHYFDYNKAHLPISMVVDASKLLMVSVSIFFLSFFAREKLKNSFPVPYRFGFVLFIATVLLYTIFLTSRYQAIRYFVPIIFIWETLLPLMLFAWVPVLKFKFIGTRNLSTVLAVAFALFYIGEYLFRLTP